MNALQTIDMLGQPMIQVKTNGGGIIWINPITVSFVGVNELGSAVFTMVNGTVIPTIHDWTEFAGLFVGGDDAEQN